MRHNLRITMIVLAAALIAAGRTPTAKPGTEMTGMMCWWQRPTLDQHSLVPYQRNFPLVQPVIRMNLE